MNAFELSTSRKFILDTTYELEKENNEMRVILEYNTFQLGV